MMAYVGIGLPTRIPPWSKSLLTSKGAGSRPTCREDVFFSALSSLKVKGEAASLSFGGSLGFPRIAIAGAKPTNFAPRVRENLTVENRVEDDNPNKRKNPYSGIAAEFFGNRDSAYSQDGGANKRRKTTKPDAQVRHVQGDENSSGTRKDARQKTQEQINSLTSQLEQILPKHIKELSEKAKTPDVVRKIADSAKLLTELITLKP